MKLEENYLSLIESCIDLASLMDKKIRPILLHKYEKERLGYQLYLYNLLIAYIKILKSIHLLLKEGNSTNSLILLRSLFELHVQQLYIRTNPKQLSIDFLWFAIVEKKRLSDMTVKTALDDDEVYLKKKLEVKESFDEIVDSYTDKNGKVFKKWHGKTLRILCEEVDKKWPEDYNLTSFYTSIYDRFSMEAHGGPLSLSLLLREEENVILPKLEPEFDYSRVVIEMSCNWAYYPMKFLNNEFHLDLKKDLRDFEKRIIKLITSRIIT